MAKTYGALHWLGIEPTGGDFIQAASWFPEGGTQADMLQGLAGFEDHPDAGDGTMVLSDPEGQLFAFLSEVATILPMRVTFEEYVEMQITVLGMGGGIELLCQLQGHGHPAGTTSADTALRMAASHDERAQRFLADAARVFPDQDLSLVARCISA